MTPHWFIEKWRASELKERSASQEHFIDLCRLLGEPTPAEADPSGDTYCFERGARKDTGGDGWADVWKRHHFAWEYKGHRADLDAAFGQLRQYSLALENPPLLIVSDMLRFRIRTNWTNSVSKTYEFGLDDLADAATRDRLKCAFSDPERLRPGETRQSLTERAAASLATVTQALRERGHDPQRVAHFVNRLVFCMFADDVGLLPDHMFTRMLRHARPAPSRFGDLASELFRAMASGGRVGFETVDWFNGSLFNDDTTLPLEKSDIKAVLAASENGRTHPRPTELAVLLLGALVLMVARSSASTHPPAPEASSLSSLGTNRATAMNERAGPGNECRCLRRAGRDRDHGGPRPRAARGRGGGGRHRRAGPRPAVQQASCPASTTNGDAPAFGEKLSISLTPPGTAHARNYALSMHPVDIAPRA